MSDLEKAQERINVICEKIRVETLTPAKLEAQQIIVEARNEAERIKLLARQEAEKILEDAKRGLEIEKQIFTSSLEQAAKQAIELLKQKIESSLFNPALEKWVIDQLGGAKEDAKLIEALVKAINADGLKTDLTIKIPQAFTPDEITSNLSRHILDMLKGSAIEVSDIKGGAKVSLKGKHMSLDLSDTALRELIASFVRKDFRKVFFAT